MILMCKLALNSCRMPTQQESCNIVCWSGVDMQTAAVF